jgi:predicted small lipoprotein YifL
MKVKNLVITVMVILTVMAVTGCGSFPVSNTSSTAATQQTARQQAIESTLPIRTMPAQRPAWVDVVPSTPVTAQSFVGSAGRYATATGNTGARYYAEENGRTQLVAYYGTLLSDRARTYASTFGITSETLAPQVAGQQLNERIAQNVAQALGPVEYYTEVYLDQTNRESYEVYVLMQVDKAIVRRVIDNYGQEQADAYKRRAAAEQDAARKQQLERAAEFFGGNLSSSLGM